MSFNYDDAKKPSIWNAKNEYQEILTLFDLFSSNKGAETKETLRYSGLIFSKFNSNILTLTPKIEEAFTPPI